MEMEGFCRMEERQNLCSHSSLLRLSLSPEHTNRYIYIYTHKWSRMLQYMLTTYPKMHPVTPPHILVDTQRFSSNSDLRGKVTVQKHTHKCRATTHTHTHYKQQTHPKHTRHKHKNTLQHKHTKNRREQKTLYRS